MLSVAIFILSTMCRAHGVLPDAACTPGAVETTDRTIVCGESTRVRRHVTDETRRAVLARYGIAWADRHAYEVDHLIPLELGGANSAANLWPEPLEDARRKDQVEDAAHRAVCSGRLDLAEAQGRFATDWRTAS